MRGAVVEQKWLTCSISPGQFPTEYAVSGTQYNGTPFSLFAPEDAVRAPAGATDGPGAVRVLVVDRRDGLALVRLPAQTFENGHHVTVGEAELSSEPKTRAATA
jgi:hypothetical protein